jgi:hypothetical protein
VLTRRALIKDGGTATAALWVLGGGAVAEAAPAGYLRRSGYAGLVGTHFSVAGASPLTLDAITDIGGRALRGSDAAFSLTLSGPVDGALAQGVHTLRHPQLGSFALFLVPVGLPADGRQSYDITIDHTVALPNGRKLPQGPRRKRLLRHVRAARRRNGKIRLDLGFRGEAAVEVLVTLTGHGRRLRGSAHVSDGAAHTILRAASRPPRGTYELVATIVRRDRSRVVERIRIRLR